MNIASTKSGSFLKVKTLFSFACLSWIMDSHEISYADSVGLFLKIMEENAAVPRYGEAF